MQVSWTWTDKLKSEDKEYTVVLKKKFSVLECITLFLFLDLSRAESSSSYRG